LSKIEQNPLLQGAADPICQLNLQGLTTARTEIQRINKFALEEVRAG
jgi:hypothetical protein